MITARYNHNGERVTVTEQISDGKVHLEALDDSGRDWFTTPDQISEIETDEPMVDLTADPWTRDSWETPAEVREALQAWDAPDHPCAGCAARVGHVERVWYDTHDREREGLVWVGCYATTDPVLFLCEDCSA